MSRIKLAIFHVLSKLKIFPSIYFFTMPFKIFEFQKLINLANINRDDIILDLGCGFGIQTLSIGRKCKHIIGIDPDKDAINYSKTLSTMVGNDISSEFIWGKLEDQKFGSNYFDKIFSICVIEHIPNYIEIMDEVYRILKPGGKFIFSVDCLENIHDKKLINKHKKEQQVIEYFNKLQLENILINAKFKNIKINKLFKSNYSIYLFIEGINNKFKYGIKYLLEYLILLRVENSTKNTKGLFLIAICTK